VVKLLVHDKIQRFGDQWVVNTLCAFPADIRLDNGMYFQAFYDLSKHYSGVSDSLASVLSTKNLDDVRFF
jgi:hypothetical protein